jgi:D-lactate dehydrogenase
MINTSRRRLINIKTQVTGLKANKVGSVGLDMFEGEGNNSDRSGDVIADDTLARLFKFSNVIVTGQWTGATMPSSLMRR